MTEPPAATSARGSLTVGTKVEVHAGFDGSWSIGFAIDEVSDAGYRLRRRSDGEVLPTVFPVDAVRRERKGSMWWM